MVRVTFTLFFEDPFWVGLVEQTSDGFTEIGRTVFGAEPSNAEVGWFVRHRLQSVELQPAKGPIPAPPDRRTATRETGRTRRSLDAYKDAVAARAAERKAARRAREIATNERKFQLTQEKKKKKRKGH